MGATDSGNQVLTYDFQQEGTSQGFNRINLKVVPSGFYILPTLTKIDNTTVTLSTFTAQIEDNSASPTPTSVRLETEAVSSNITVSTTNIYVVVRFAWSNTANNYADFLAIPEASIQSDDLIVGRCIFDGSTLDSFDYSRQSIAPIIAQQSNDNNLKVTADEPIGTDVNVSSGTALIEDAYIDFAGGSVTLPILSGSNRNDIVYLDSSGSLGVVTGSDSATAIPPLDHDKLALAIVSRSGVGTNTVIGSDITQLFTPVNEKKVLTGTQVFYSSGTNRALEINTSYTGGATPAVEIGSIVHGSYTVSIEVESGIHVSGTNPWVFFNEDDQDTDLKNFGILGSNAELRFYSLDDSYVATGRVLVLDRNWTQSNSPAVAIGAPVIGTGTAVVSLLAQGYIGISGSSPVLRFYETDTSKAWNVSATDSDILFYHLNSAFSSVVGHILRLNSDYTNTTTPAVEIGAKTIAGAVNVALLAQTAIGITGANTDLIMYASNHATGYKYWNILNYSDSLSFRRKSDDGSTELGRYITLSGAYASTTPAVEIGSVEIYTGGTTVSLLAQTAIGITGASPVLRFFETDGTEDFRHIRLLYNGGDFSFKVTNDEGDSVVSALLSLQDGWDSTTNLMVLGGSGSDVAISGSVSIGNGVTENGLLSIKLLDGDTSVSSPVDASPIVTLARNAGITVANTYWNPLWWSDTSSNGATPAIILAPRTYSASAAGAQLEIFTKDDTAITKRMIIGAATGAEVQVIGSLSTTGTLEVTGATTLSSTLEVNDFLTTTGIVGHKHEYTTTDTRDDVWDDISADLNFTTADSGIIIASGNFGTNIIYAINKPFSSSLVTIYHSGGSLTCLSGDTTVLSSALKISY